MDKNWNFTSVNQWNNHANPDPQANCSYPVDPVDHPTLSLRSDQFRNLIDYAATVAAQAENVANRIGGSLHREPEKGSPLSSGPNGFVEDFGQIHGSIVSHLDRAANALSRAERAI